MKTLTISIAAYNVEKYLAATLESLSDKRLAPYIEVLIIDDGSKDGTGAIAKSYANKYPEVFRYVAKENGGHGSTINKGMELATAKYFRVLDGDDSLDVENLLALIKRMDMYDEDMFISDFRAITTAGEIYIDPYVMKNGKSIFSSLQDNMVYAMDDNLPHMAMIGLSTLAIKTDLLKKYAFTITEHCYYVDVEFVVWCMAIVDSFRFFSAPVYLYLKDCNTANSVSKNNMIKNIHMQEKVSYKLLAMYRDFAQENFMRKKKHIIQARIISVLSAVIRTYMLMPDSRRKIKAFEARIKEKSLDIYNAMATDAFCKWLRRHDYMFLPLLTAIYRMYVKYKYH